MKTPLKLCSVATGLLLLSACGGGSSTHTPSTTQDKPLTCNDTQLVSADGKSCLNVAVSNIAQEYTGTDNDTLRLTITGENLENLDVAVDACESGTVISKNNTTIVYECTPKQAGDTILILNNKDKKVYSQTFTINDKPISKPTSKLTATGMTTCGNDLKNGLPCDSLTGEWKELPQDGLVLAGQAMSYEELMVNGETCIKDNVTGLVWEKKTSSGLHSMDNTYSWYNTDEKTNGGKEGYQNKGTCDGGANSALCDTQNYIAELNKQKYCGYSDWRLPTLNELYSIANYNKIPSISDIFDDVKQDNKQYWWSSTPDNEEPENYVWAIDYYSASTTTYNDKKTGLAVRAVRTGVNK
ncbi:DUF1566 domain-containing protein [Psychrobacter sp. I-STPA6b]|uniref:Lcl C-terminal domain-containing protein n=1 Tax=Psychrobacter sp. I-STPA6b TaxID=2585718 RepID=UPI001D0C3A20|nr:DUF1566 domain-containing protein [Psychrobacter sp. I-STPA6b]